MSESGDRKEENATTPPRGEAAVTAPTPGNRVSEDGDEAPRLGPLPPLRPPPPRVSRPLVRPLEDAKVVVAPDAAHGEGEGEALSDSLATTHGNIELGHPIIAVAAIGALLALGGAVLGGLHAGQSVAVGGAIATVNLWAFTQIGTAFLSRRGVSASWGVLAGAKLAFLFVGVGVVLKADVATPASFLVGYLALPIGIVASQLLGLRADFDQEDGPS